MKTEAKHLNTASYGAQRTQAFGIMQTGEMYALLSTKIYTDAKLAVIRELAANGLDAHKAAGTWDTPVDIHLPQASYGYGSPDDQKFRIRDYGTGLSEDLMFDLYTNYGGSNKNDSNEFIGGMGIGSKAPFAYADVFEVNSYQNGTKKMYICALDSERKPELKLFGSEETSEPNGLEVIVDVRDGDCWDFKYKATKVFQHFPVKPNILNDSLAYDVEEPTFQGDGWSVSPDTSSRVIMGYISYPLESSHFAAQEPATAKKSSYDKSWYAGDEKKQKEKLDPIEQRLVELGVSLSVDIGDVQMAASREALQYTDATKEFLRVRLKKVAEELKLLIESKFSQCRDYYEACQVYAGLDTKVVKLIGTTGFMFGGVALKDTVTVPSLVPVKCFSVKNGRSKREDNFNRWSAGTQIIENDLPIGAYIRTAEWVRVNDQKAILVDFRRCSFVPHIPVTSLTGDPLPPVPVDPVANKAFFLETIGASDDSLFVKASSIPAPPKQPRRQGVPKLSVFCIERQPNGRYYIQEEDKVDLEDIDEATYVELNSNWFYDHNAAGRTKFATCSLYELLRSCNDLGIVLPPVYAVKTAALERFKKKVKDAKPFLAVASDTVTQYLTANAVSQKVADNEAFKKHEATYDRLDAIFSGAAVAHATNTLKPIYDKLEGYKRQASSIKQYQDLAASCKAVGIVLADAVPEDFEASFKAALAAKYPLLGAFKRWELSQYKAEILDYLWLKDTKTEVPPQPVDTPF